MPSGRSHADGRAAGSASVTCVGALPAGVVAGAEGQPAVDRAGGPRAERTDSEPIEPCSASCHRCGVPSAVDVVPAQPGGRRRSPRSRRCAAHLGGRPASRTAHARPPNAARASRTSEVRDRAAGHRPGSAGGRRTGGRPPRRLGVAASVGDGVLPRSASARRGAAPAAGVVGALRRVGEQVARRRVSNASDVARRDQHGGVADQVGQPADGGGDQRHAGAQRLLGEQLPGLPVAGDHGEVGGGEQVGHVAAVPEQGDRGARGGDRARPAAGSRARSRRPPRPATGRGSRQRAAASTSTS